MREQRRAHLRDLAFTVRRNLELAQRRYKKSYDRRVYAVKQALRVGDWVYVDTHAKDRKKLDQKVEGPYRFPKRDSHTFTVLGKGFPDRGSSDHVARALTPAGQFDYSTMIRGPQQPEVFLDHDDTGLSFVWERLVGHDRDQEGNLWLLVRWWAFISEEDTWRPWHKFERDMVTQCCLRVGTEPPIQEEQAVALRELFWAIYTVWPWCLEPGADLWARAEPSPFCSER